MHYVYIIKSVRFPTEYYVGYTVDLKERISKHNEGGSPHTSKFKPWKLSFYSAFQDKVLALAFEKYLKSHSGKAFSAKHLI